MLFPSVPFLSAVQAVYGNKMVEEVQVDAKTLHILKRTEPVYPALARAAHISGDVKIRVVIGPDGHVKSSTVAGGSPLLTGAAQESVVNWVFEPVLDGAGRPETVSALLTVAFQPGMSGHSDDKTTQIFFRAEGLCRQEVLQKAPTTQQAADCSKAAQISEAFNSDERFVERRSAFVYASTALLRNQQTKEALDYANKAVSVVEQGHDDDAGASAAYSVRAQAEAISGDLAKASDDLAESERHEREAIRKMSTDAPELVKREYLPTLKYVLGLESRVFAAQGDRTKAAEKTAEAAKL